MLMADLAQEIKAQLRKAARKCSEKELAFVENYLGTKRSFICVKAADRNKVINNAIKEFRKLDPDSAIDTLNNLFKSNTFEDINIAGKLLTKLPLARRFLKFNQLEIWLEETSGWAECDSICQSLYSEEEVLGKWSKWQEMIRKFSDAKNIQLRRASLVLQVKPIRESNDERLTKLAFETIEKLKGEKEVLITKAISWLLRALSIQNRDDVLQYLRKNQASLPKIAYRETIKKITTGKK